MIERVVGDLFLANVLRLSKKKTVAEFYARTAEVRDFSRHMNQKVCFYHSARMMSRSHGNTALGRWAIRCNHLSCASSTSITASVSIVDAWEYELPLTNLCRAVAQVATICGSTIIYNLLDNPVGVVPVTRVDPDKDRVTPEWYQEKQHNVISSPVLHALLYKGKNSVYNAKKMAGLPVGIQIAGRKWQEEKLLAIMKVVDSSLGQRSFGPGSWETMRAT